jgi:hypothetical protein
MREAAREWWKNGPPTGRDVRAFKSAHDGRGSRVIEGAASTSTFTSKGQARKAEGCKVELPVPVLWRHEKHSKIGEVTYAAVSPQGVWVRCSIDHSARGDIAWQEIRSGRALCFSVGGGKGVAPAPGMMMADGLLFPEWVLNEVSVCPKGANPDCRFHVVRDLPKARPTVKLITRVPGAVYLRRRA